MEVPELTDHLAAVRHPVPFNDLRRDDGSLTEAASAVAHVVASGHYLMGPHVGGLETALTEWVGGAGAVAVASGTDALVLALESFGVPHGTRVLVPANAGGYASIAARLAGYIPVVADVHPDSLLVSVETLQQAASPDVRIVVATHLYGQVVPDIAKIRAWCDETGRFLVEDCAQAAGAQREGRSVGGFAHAAAFSFYPTKNLGAMGDAGAVTVADPESLTRVRQLAQYGWKGRYLATLPLGRNSRMDEIQAAVLQVRLRRLRGLNERRREVGRAYVDAVAGGPLRLIGADDPENVWHLAVLECDDRSRVQAHLAARQVSTAVHYPVPDHRQPGLEAEVPAMGVPVAEGACTRILTLPCFPTLTDGEVLQVIDALRSYTADRAS